MGAGFIAITIGSYQVQFSADDFLELEEWGRKRSFRGLEPIVIMPESDYLLRSISCKCKKNCGNARGCRQAVLCCSVLCINYNKNCCSNVLDLTATIHEDDLDHTDNTLEKLTNIVVLDENQEDVDESLPSTSH